MSTKQPTPPKKWDDLTKRQREQVLYMFGALEEFHFGFGALEDANEKVPQGATPHRFLLNSLYAYACSFFLSNGDNLLTLLASLGHSDVAEPALTILNRPLGNASLKDVLRIYRRRYLAHPAFSYRIIESALKPKVDLGTPENARLLAEANDEFFNAIIWMRKPLSERFPEAFEQTTAE